MPKSPKWYRSCFELGFQQHKEKTVECTTHSFRRQVEHTCIQSEQGSSWTAASPPVLPRVPWLHISCTTLLLDFVPKCSPVATNWSVCGPFATKDESTSPTHHGYCWHLREMGFEKGTGRDQLDAMVSMGPPNICSAGFWTWTVPHTVFRIRSFAQ